MKSPRILLSATAVLAAVSVMVAAGCGGGSDDVPADAVAIIDGTPVTRTQLDTLVARLKTSYAASNRAFPKAGTSEFQSLQAGAVAYLVQREEYAREAKDLGITISDKQVEDRLTEIKKQYFGGDQKKFEAQIKAQGFTLEDVTADTAVELQSDAIAEKLVADVKVTPAEILKFKTANLATTRDVRHILVKTQAEADAVYAQLKGGASFAALAKAKSLDTGSKDLGGKLTITKGQTVPPFDKAAFALAVNEISKPVKTRFGYHVIQVLPGPSDAQTKQSILEERKTTALAKWAEDLQKKYEDKVTYATGYAPPATSDTTTG